MTRSNMNATNEQLTKRFGGMYLTARMVGLVPPRICEACRTGYHSLCVTNPEGIVGYRYCECPKCVATVMRNWAQKQRERDGSQANT